MNNHTNEEDSKRTETNGNTRTRQSFWSGDMSSMMNACCAGMEGSDNMMGRCCKSFMGAIWWFALIPIIIAAAALLLGYYLSPDSIQVLWMVGWGSIIGITILGLITMRILWRKFSLHNCCGQNFRKESE